MNDVIQTTHCRFKLQNYKRKVSVPAVPETEKKGAQKKVAFHHGNLCKGGSFEARNTDKICLSINIGYRNSS